MSLLDILQQYINPNAAPHGNVESHFDEVSQQTSTPALGRGVAEAFRSNATPSFGQAVGSLFGQSNGLQQAGVLNQFIQSIGPAALSGAAGGILGRVMGSTGVHGGAPPTISPAQASQLSPADVSQIATHAEENDPSIVDRVGEFYAQHPALVKTMGAVALGAIMSHLSQSRN